MDQLSETSPSSSFYRGKERTYTWVEKPSPLSYQPTGRERFKEVLAYVADLPKERLIRHLVVLGLVVGTFLGTFNPEVADKEPQSSAQEEIEDTVIPPVETPVFNIATDFEKSTLAGLNNQERNIAEQEINYELLNFQNDKENIDRTLGLGKMVELVVNDQRLKIPDEEKQYWKEAMLQIIFVESRGNPYADPVDKMEDITDKQREVLRKTSAKGLTQLKPSTAEEIAEHFQIPEYSLINSWDNIFLGLAHQLEMSRIYGKGLGIQVHHLGMGNAEEAIKAYQANTKKVNPVKLLLNSAVINTLQKIGAFNDDTERYFYRVVAAGRAMFNPQTKV